MFVKQISSAYRIIKITTTKSQSAHLKYRLISLGMELDMVACNDGIPELSITLIFLPAILGQKGIRKLKLSGTTYFRYECRWYYVVYTIIV